MLRNTIKKLRKDQRVNRTINKNWFKFYETSNERQVPLRNNKAYKVISIEIGRIKLYESVERIQKVVHHQSLR